MLTGFAVLYTVNNMALNWKTYPMGGAAAERTQRLKKPAYLDHAVNLDTGKTLCGVKTTILCMDSSLATNEMPDCPKCRAILKRLTSTASKLSVTIDGKTGTVERAAYVKSKTKALQQFGYPSLTEKQTDEQVDAVLKGLKFGEGLTVIGMFLQKDKIAQA